MRTRFFKFIATFYNSETREFWREKGYIQSWTKKQAKKEFTKGSLPKNVTLVKVIFIFEKEIK